MFFSLLLCVLGLHAGNCYGDMSTNEATTPQEWKGSQLKEYIFFNQKNNTLCTCFCACELNSSA